MDLDRLGPWPARAAWLIAPLMIGPAIRAALDEIGGGRALTLEIAAWAFWFVVLVATLAPSTPALTVARAGTPIAVVIAAISAVPVGGVTTAVSVAVGGAALATALVFLPTFGDRMINGSAYGSERRMALRPPAFALVGPAQLAWLAVCLGVLGGPVLLAGGWTIAAAIAAVIGVGAVWAGGRVLHQLARRWIVFVPAGFVIHDPVGLVDAVLLRRNVITALGPAVVDTADAPDAGPGNDAVLDLSGGALGLALAVAIDEPTPVTVRERGQARNTEAGRLIFTPTLPGALLSEARIRGIKIGEATPTLGPDGI